MADRGGRAALNAQQSLNVLRDIADWFAVRGRRKAILFVSEGIDYDINDFANTSGASSIMTATRDAVAAAARGNASIYGIDPRGLTNLGDQTIELGSLPTDTEASALGLSDSSLREELRLSQDSLRELSDDTGGFAVVNANDFATAFDRIVRDNSSYYAMAYYPPSDKAGRFHKIEVKVGRPGLQVRARQGYLTVKAAAGGRNARAVESGPGGRDTTPEIREAFSSPLPVSGLTMNVFAAPFKGPAPNASIVLGVEVRGRDMRLNSSDKLAVTYAAVDAKGKMRGGSTSTVGMTLKPETRERVAATGLRLLNRLELPPGRYQLRVAAHDSGGGNVGSVLRPRRSRLRQDAAVDERHRLRVRGRQRTDRPPGRGAPAGAAWPAGGLPQLSAERRCRAVRRGLRQRRFDAAQGGHHDHRHDRRGTVLVKMDEARDSSELQNWSRRLRLRHAPCDEGVGARFLRPDGLGEVAAARRPPPSGKCSSR